MKWNESRLNTFYAKWEDCREAFLKGEKKIDFNGVSSYTRSHFIDGYADMLKKNQFEEILEDLIEECSKESVLCYRNFEYACYAAILGGYYSFALDFSYLVTAITEKVGGSVYNSRYYTINKACRDHLAECFRFINFYPIKAKSKAEEFSLSYSGYAGANYSFQENVDLSLILGGCIQIRNLYEEHVLPWLDSQPMANYTYRNSFGYF